MSLLDRRKLFPGYKANRRRREPPIVVSCPICPWRSRPCSPKKAEARYQVHVALRHAVAWFLAALLLFVGVAMAQEPPRTFRVPFHLVKGLILLDAKVNGQPATLLLDSGANNSIVDFRTAALADTKLDKLRSTGNVGAEGDCVVREVHLALEHRSWLNRRVCVMDLSDASKRLGEHIDGFVGADVLGEFSAVRIDFKNHVVELESAQ